MTTVLLIDYPPAVRDALRARLSVEPDVQIVGEADDGPTASAWLGHLIPMLC